MDDEPDPVLEAVETLRARGHRVESLAGDHMLWQVDDEVLAEADLLALANLFRLVDSPGEQQ